MPSPFFAYGQERLLDDRRFVAHRAAADGATVNLHQYNGLPHICALLFPTLAQSRHMVSQWAEFCRVCVEEPDKLLLVDSRANKNRYVVYEPVESENGVQVYGEEGW